MKKMNLKRTKRQITAVNKWLANNNHGTLQFATGVGKTNTAIIAIKKIRKIGWIDNVHVVVPTKYLKSQWESELKKANLPYVEVFVINTYIKQERSCDLLILDEIHNYGSSKRIEVFETGWKWILGLTATMERRDDKHHLINLYSPIVDTIDLDEARSEGYVSDYIVYNFGIELNPSDRQTLNDYNKEFYRHFSFFGHDFKLAMKCMSDKGAREKYAKLMSQDEKSVGFHAVRFNYFMQKRKNFLYNLSSKLEVTKQIINLFAEEKKIVTFSESIDFADSIPGISYHSKVKKSVKAVNLNRFKGPVFNVLNTSKALDEGFDVGDIELVIITSSRAVQRVDIQRTGRAIRFKEGKLAVIVNLYVKNSKDEDWLRQRQKKASNIYWIDNINEIKFERPKIKVSKSGGKQPYQIGPND